MTGTDIQSLKSMKQRILDRERDTGVRMLGARRKFNQRVLRGGMKGLSLSIIPPSELCPHPDFMGSMDASCKPMPGGATSEVYACEESGEVRKVAPADASDLGVLARRDIESIHADAELLMYVEIGKYYDCCHYGVPRTCNTAGWVKDGQTLHSMAAVLSGMRISVGKKRNREGHAKIANRTELEAVELQLLHALDKINMRHQVYHNDIHMKNVLVVARHRQETVELSVRGTPITVLTQYAPVIIDWDYASKRYVETSDSGTIIRVRSMFADTSNLRSVQHADLITYLARLENDSPSKMLQFAIQFDALPPLLSASPRSKLSPPPPEPPSSPEPGVSSPVAVVAETGSTDATASSFAR